MSVFFDNFKSRFYLNSQVKIFDNSQMLLENCKNVLEVNENVVRVISSCFEIEVWGTDLSATYFSSKTVMIKGKIQNVNITKRGKNEDVV